MTDRIEGIDPRLEMLSSEPLVLQTPMGLLAGRRTTDPSVLFVRNCQDLPSAMTMGPMPLDDWHIELAGLIRPGRLVIRAADLLEMEQVELEMVLQCAGNGRTMYRGVPGTRWGLGGVGNVRFGGVPLAAVLARHGVELDPRVRFVTARARQDPGATDQPAFEHSLPVGDVLERSILALTLDGKPMPGIHGGPVRLVTPGYFGTMQVKWLGGVRFETVESPTHYHASEYRVPHGRVEPGDGFRFTLENSRPTWSLRLTSLILDPPPGAVVPGDVTVRGVAFNDGSAALESVLVSVDRGETWKEARLRPPGSPYAWYPWSLRTHLQGGTSEIWARAVDALGRTQPMDGSVHWNPNGYEWAGVAKVEVRVDAGA
ncbi:MAG: molybdopterin-dependent oxidoreductase [Chloroflexota bacterium]